ncbi:hypothetical protein BKA61DRAFT_567592 [Leptodontidium sp. MPI-SDFR-AT-0119]|nr:hypothetical protein BKA61DRAFT_567592 [Leptodontidium sp. MPI-SDFR-AT-0119]
MAGPKEEDSKFMVALCMTRGRYHDVFQPISPFAGILSVTETALEDLVYPVSLLVEAKPVNVVMENVVEAYFAGQVADALYSAHDKGGHFAMTITLRKLRHVYWPTIVKDTSLYIAGLSTPIELLGAHFCGPFHDLPEEYRYLLIVVDYFSRFIWTYPCPGADSLNVNKCLNSPFFTDGVPVGFYVDPGSHFGDIAIAKTGPSYVAKLQKVTLEVNLREISFLDELWGADSNENKEWSDAVLEYVRAHEALLEKVSVASDLQRQKRKEYHDLRFQGRMRGFSPGFIAMLYDHTTAGQKLRPS